MRLLGAVSTDEVLASWLSQELRSDRFADKIRSILKEEGMDESRSVAADPGDVELAQARRRLMELYRGYGGSEGYLAGFPTHGVRWERVAMTPDELLSVRFIDWSYWLELSAGSRSALRAAEQIRLGVTPYGVSHERFQQMATAVRQGAVFPELIVVTTGEPGAQRVLLEGHARLTAYALAADALPMELAVILGTSREVAEWWAY